MNITVTRTIWLGEGTGIRPPVEYRIDETYHRNPGTDDWSGIRTISLFVLGELVALKVYGFRPSVARTDTLNDMATELLPRKVTPVLGPPPVRVLKENSHA